MRLAGDTKFSLFYRGLNRVYLDRRAGIQAANPNPNNPNVATHGDIVEYCVTAVNGNGESARSRIADTDPASWRNWDPKPGEAFRRDFIDDSPSASIKVHAEWPHYYPR